MSQHIPDHVRRIIDREGDLRFTPPSFERWVGRLHMLRTFCSSVAFIFVAVVSMEQGQAWEGAVIRGIIAAIVINFLAWAGGLLLFGELYDAEVKQARHELEERERERARRIEAYYRERLQAQQAEADGMAGVTPIGSRQGASTPSYGQPEAQRYAA